MTPPGVRLLFLLPVAALSLSGCASTESTPAAITAAASGKPARAGAPDKPSAGRTRTAENEILVRRERNGSPKRRSEDGASAIAAKPPAENASARSSEASGAAPMAANSSSVPAPEGLPPAKNRPRPTPDEAAFSDAAEKEKSLELKLRLRHGLPAKADLRSWLLPDEAKELDGLRAKTEAARLRLSVPEAQRPSLADAERASPISVPHGPARTEPLKTVAELPTVTQGGGKPPTELPNPLRLSDWILDDKPHEAWRQKRLARQAEEKKRPEAEPPNR